MKLENKYALRCMAPDGKYVTEGFFPSVQEAWNRADDMGSRWFFYPVCIITGASRSKTARIVAVPHGMADDWIGRTIGRLAKSFSANADHVADYCNGKTPLCLLP